MHILPLGQSAAVAHGTQLAYPELYSAHDVWQKFVGSSSSSSSSSSAGGAVGATEATAPLAVGASVGTTGAALGALVGCAVVGAEGAEEQDPSDPNHARYLSLRTRPTYLSAAFSNPDTKKQPPRFLVHGFIFGIDWEL